MSDLDRNLAALRDLHRHSAALLNDPAVWAGLGAGFALAVAIALLLGRTWSKHAALQHEVRVALGATRLLPPSERLAEQAKILRRAALVRLGSDGSTLRGDAWLAALDRMFHTDFFTASAGRCFAADLYAAPAAGGEGLTAQLEALVPRLRR